MVNLLKPIHLATKGKASRTHSYEQVLVSTTTKDTPSKRAPAKGDPIRRVIENKVVPIPTSWANYLVLFENKADLAEHSIASALQQKVIVTAKVFDVNTEG